MNKTHWWFVGIIIIAFKLAINVTAILLVLLWWISKIVFTLKLQYEVLRNCNIYLFSDHCSYIVWILYMVIIIKQCFVNENLNLRYLGLLNKRLVDFKVNAESSLIS